MKKRISRLLTTLILAALLSTMGFTASESNIGFVLNGQVQTWNEKDLGKLFLKDGRSFIPLRAVSEKLGYQVVWNASTNTADIEKDDTKITFTIGKKDIATTKGIVTLDVQPFIMNGRTYVPMRGLFEAVDMEVRWLTADVAASELKTATTSMPADYYVVVGGAGTDLPKVEPKATDLELGLSLASVEKLVGAPTAIVKSEYGFNWHIYAKDYKTYLQVGILNDKTVALYTTSDAYPFSKGFIGVTKTDMRKRYNLPLTRIQKGSTFYTYSSSDQVDRYEEGDHYMNAFYDQHNSDIVFAFMIIDKNVEKGLSGFHGVLTEDVRKGYELQLFHLANAARAAHGKTPFIWDDAVAAVARSHSADMAKNNYISHTNLKGLSPFDRMKAAGISYRSAAENIAANQNAIFTHASWMNSEGHRKNILGNTERLGVGTALSTSADYQIYHTQKFYTPK